MAIPAGAMRIVRAVSRLFVFALAACAGVSAAQADPGDRDWTPVDGPAHRVDRGLRAPLDEAVRRRAGEGARACSAPGKQWGDALRCVMDARAQHAAAYVSHASFGVDSLVGWGIVSHAGGELDLYRYDSSPCGGGDCAYRLDTARCRRVADAPKPGAKVEHVCLDPEL
jgi:hypothetical protein